MHVYLVAALNPLHYLSDKYLSQLLLRLHNIAELVDLTAILIFWVQELALVSP